MCTVSIISTASRVGSNRAVRLVCNRDELRARAEALPPRVRAFGGRLAVMPIDPQGGGTWIAVSDAGIAMVLLNQTTSAHLTSDSASMQSRGQIIPSLLDRDSFDEALERAGTIDPRRFQPFLLVILGTRCCAEFVSHGRSLRTRRYEIGDVPLMFTSSGLGDHLVQQPRRELFEQLFGRTRGTPARQDAFHAHRWPQCPHLSIDMSRHDARTVSRTTIEFSTAHARVTYAPLEPGVSRAVSRLELDTHQAPQLA